MAYTKTTWVDYPSVDTIIDADKLNNMEDGIEANSQSGKNLLINGNFDIWQRGTSFATSFSYICDRWIGQTAGALTTFTRQANTSSTNSKYMLRMVNPSSQVAAIIQKIENPNNILYNKKTTLSFWVKGSVAATFKTRLVNSGPVIALIGEKNYNVTTSWQKIELNFDASTGWLNDDTITLELASLTTSVPAGTFEFSQVKFEIGNVATDFEADTYGNQLRECQRYYYRIGGVANKRLFLGIGSSTTVILISISEILNILRSIPSVTFADLQLLRDGVSTYTVNTCSIALDTLQVTTTGYVTGSVGSLGTTTASGFIAFESEL